MSTPCCMVCSKPSAWLECPEHTDAERADIYRARLLGLRPEHERAQNDRQELHILRRDLGALRGAVARAGELVGCGDSLCSFERPHGMATNGGCRCLRKPFVGAALAALYLAAKALAGGKP